MIVDRPPLAGALVVAPMRRRHLKPVMRIDALVYPRPWSMGLFLSELSLTRARSYVVARVDRGVVAYGGLMFVDDEAHVTTIAVDPEHQRRGIAKALMVVMARHAMARGAKALTLEVRSSNRAAQDLYRKLGFQPAGVRRGYYPDNREDAIVMWAHDIATAGYADLLASIESDLDCDLVVDPALPTSQEADAQ